MRTGRVAFHPWDLLPAMWWTHPDHFGPREVDDFVLTPLPHIKHGLSVELCDDARAWPKPFADPVALEVKRKRGFWSRVQSWFGG